MEKQKSKIKQIKLRLAIMLVGIIIVAVFVFWANRDYNEFVDYVDKFCKDWNGLIEELDDKYPDKMMVDARTLVLAINLKDMSKIYDKIADKEEVNEYLASNIDQYTFHQAINYIRNSKYSDLYEFSDELYKFYEKPMPFQGLEISNIEFYSGTDDYVHCTFSVTNSGKYAQRYVQATIYFKDKVGNILRHDIYGLIGDNDLEVGDTKKLDINSFIKEGVNSCDMVIDD